MITGFFTIIGVLLGFYLARYSEINPAIKETFKKIRKPKPYGIPFVVRTDEAKLEREQQRNDELDRDL